MNHLHSAVARLAEGSPILLGRVPVAPPVGHLVVRLRGHLQAGRLSGRDAEFAQSLINQFSRPNGGLSEKQAIWVGKLVDRAEGTEPPKPTVARVEVAGILELFAKGGASLKFPKIRLQAADGQHVVLNRAGEKSSAPGSINVTDGGAYGVGKWFGRIDPKSGAWVTGRELPPADVVALVEALAANPAEVAARYGHLTGRCCFCDRGLDDARSTAVGYGPVCAKNFGLPWGEGPEPTGGDEAPRRTRRTRRTRRADRKAAKPDVRIEFPSAGATYSRPEYGVYEYGVYERSSVLAGQQRRVFLASFETLEAAKAAYPDAYEAGCGYVAPYLEHLPEDGDIEHDVDVDWNY